MSRNKIVSCRYNADMGTSVCKVCTPYGEVYGVAAVYDDDKDVASEYVGCSIAHYRARTQAARKKANALYYKYLGAKAVSDQYGPYDDYAAKARATTENFYRQYKSAKSVYENMRSYDRELCDKLVSEKRKIAARAELLKES